MPIDMPPPVLQAPAPAPSGRVSFAGSAELRDAYTGLHYGVLTESCTSDGRAMIDVALARPFTLNGTERLEIHVSYPAIAATSVGAQEQTVRIAGWAASSRVGCIAAGQPVTLDTSPGGLLGSLLVLRARGAVRPVTP